MEVRPSPVQAKGGVELARAGCCLVEGLARDRGCGSRGARNEMYSCGKGVNTSENYRVSLYGEDDRQ